MKSINFIFIISILFSIKLQSNTYNMCQNCEINSLNKAFNVLKAGDTLSIENGTYSGGQSTSNMKGSNNQFILIIGNNKDSVIIESGNSAMQLSDCEFIRFENITFTKQNLNGVNIDDAGTYDTPTHHIQFVNCIFSEMQSTGNNDLLKLSGLEDFLIQKSQFINGANGGSGIDMVGCHSGTITENEFTNMGSNSIQNKGGTENIYITKNKFTNGGARAINIGGSTGLEYFRPLDAEFESARIKVHSNIFIGSETPFAFVGTTDSEVINNTIIFPNKWIFRILQESTDERFVQCSNNRLYNNIFLVNSQISFSPINIGSNTLPKTFEFSNNLFYNIDNSDWLPDLPTENIDFLNEDPVIDLETLKINKESNIKNSGLNVAEPKYDFYNNEFLLSRSIGAEEISEIMNSVKVDDNITIKFNNNLLSIESPNIMKNITIYDLLGRKIQSITPNNYAIEIELKNNIYLLEITTDKTFFKIIR